MKTIFNTQAFKQVKWHPDCAPEDFSFFVARMALDEEGAAEPVDGYIYRPHPETKPDRKGSPRTKEQ